MSRPVPAAALLGGLGIAAAATVGASVLVGVGSVLLTPADAWTALTDPAAAPRLHVVAVQARLPRALLGVGVGAALGAAGALLQALFRNPLASPELTGASQGAVAAIVAWLVLGPGLAPGQVTWALPVLALAGGSATAALVATLGRTGGSADPTRLVLTGVLVGGVLSAVTTLCLLTSGEDVQALLDWLSGSLALRTWDQVRLLLVAGLLALPLVLAAIPRANLLQLGDDVAAGLGSRLDPSRSLVLGAAVALTAAAVSVAGAIGFVGLVAPHALRPAVGADLRRLVPAAALGGGLLVVVADTVARNVDPSWLSDAVGVELLPRSLPVGVYLAALGVPAFLVLLRRTR